MSVGALDLAVLLGYMAFMVVLGMWLGRGARDVAEYAVGSRDLPWWLILFSIIATETSSVTFLSIPGFAFERDFTWLQIALGFVLGRFAVAFLLLPEYFKGTLFTSYEVLHRLFGGATRQTASVLFILTRSLADGLRLFLSAIVLQEMTGISIVWAVAALGITTIIYTYLGGMRAVLWSDLIQFFLYITGALVALWAILTRLPGGWDQLLAMGSAAGKFHTFDFRLDGSEPYGFWAGLIGGAFITLGSHGVDQLMVQRYLSTRSLPEARRAVWVSGLVVVAQFALFLLIGVGLWSFYQLHAPAVPFDRADRVFARFILDELPTGLVGLLLGAIFAAAMTSSLNSCATVAVNDLYVPLAKREPSPERQLRMTRILTALFGAVQIAVGIAGQWLKASIVSSVLGIAAFTTGIVLGLFFLGLFTRRVGQHAALAGLVFGFVAMTAVFFGTSLAWPWYALAGALLTVGGGLAASAIWPRDAAR